MELEHLTFVEVLERLANRANIPLPEAKLSLEQRARDERRKKLYEACDLAATFSITVSHKPLWERWGSII